MGRLLLTGPRRERLADGIGLLLLYGLLLDYLRPSLLLLPTITAGGDTPCHYPTAAWLVNELLPKGRLHGWYPGAYLGHPLLLYYFPLPFLVMAALAPLFGLPVAFKLGTALGVFLLPALGYAMFRLLGLGFPAPLLAAAGCVTFLFVEDNPIWGGTLASTLAGEFAYTYGTGLALLFLGLVWRAARDGRPPGLPALALAVTALAHGYAVLWAGLSASFLLVSASRPLRRLRWLAGVALLAFGLSAFWLLPLLADWGWTTPFNDAWIAVSWSNRLPRTLWPHFAVAVLGLVVPLLRGSRPDARLLYLFWAAGSGVGLSLAGPALGIIDVRFLPLAQLAGALAGSAALGLALAPLLRADLIAVGLVALTVVAADASSKVLRAWIDWNYTGLEARELWPDFRRLAERLRGGVADPRVAVEYGTLHERAGSIRSYETLPFFSGRSTLEGVYNQASPMTHPVYVLASELGETSPNPFRSVQFSSFDTEAALRHLRLLNVRDVVAVSGKLQGALSGRADVESLGRVGPYALFRLRGSFHYVEPLAFQPVRSSPRSWRARALRWFTRRPPAQAHLVFSDDPRFEVVEANEWLAPPEVPLPGGVEVRETVENEEITFETSRPGHPLLVKVAYHPRWRASGADGPYLVSPGLMMVVPRETRVTLRYSASWADSAGRFTTAGVVLLLAGGWIRRRLH
jgi:hypothetical protein